MDSNEIVAHSAWRCPSNIAIIKYWGKHGNQLPVNPSVSLSLKNAFTEMEVTLTARKENDPVIAARLFLGEYRNEKFEQRIIHYFEGISGFLPFIRNYRFDINSENSFPHSSGIASSASSMSALALNLLSLESQLGMANQDTDLFYRRASELSRLASGSASRSVYGGWSVWGELESVPGSSDEFAIPLPFSVHPIFAELQDAILITSSTPKKISSSAGHYLMSDHPYSQARKAQALEHASRLIRVLQDGDFPEFARIAESEALSLHALMLSSDPGYFLVNEFTLEIIDKVRAFREETGTNICFTLDAGPNVHLLYPFEEKDNVRNFLREELIMLCEGGKWIDDGAGSGPTLLQE